jgi:hypothetical protein
MKFFRLFRNIPLKPVLVISLTGLLVLGFALQPLGFISFPSMKRFLDKFSKSKTKTLTYNVTTIETVSKTIENDEKLISKPVKKPKAIKYKLVGDGLLKPTSLLTIPCLVKKDKYCLKWGLDNFYASLYQTQNKKGVTRISYFGDSIIANDKISSTLREKFQTKFGYSGPGWLSLADLWKWAKHEQVFKKFSSEWVKKSVMGPYIGHRKYGYGGIFVHSLGRGIDTTFQIKGKYGKINRVKATYLMNMEGGSFNVVVLDKIVKTIDTKGEQNKEMMLSLQIPPTKRVKIQSASSGVVKFTGVVLENSTPGVVVDFISLTGASFFHLDLIDHKHWQKEIRMRNPNLMIFHFGANESDNGINTDYEKKISKLITRTLKDKNNLSCLVMGSTDKITKKSGEYKTKWIIKRINRLLRKIALKNGCAFYDSWKSMGGEASILEWQKKELAVSDFTHLTIKGGKLFGSTLYMSLIKGYIEHLQGNSR